VELFGLAETEPANLATAHNAFSVLHLGARRACHQGIYYLTHRQVGGVQFFAVYENRYSWNGGTIGLKWRL
jgi:hypothetical protein